MRFCRNIYLQHKSLEKHRNEKKTDLCILQSGGKASIIFNGAKDLPPLKKQHLKDSPTDCLSTTVDERAASNLPPVLPLCPCTGTETCGNCNFGW